MDEYIGYSANLYDLVHIGPAGDIAFYVEKAKQYGSPMLEIGCGTGRTLVPVYEAGIDAVGIDLSADMLAVARLKAGANGPGSGKALELVQADMTSFALGRSFNLIICSLYSFEQLTDIYDQRRALKCVYDHLSPGGAFIVHISRPDIRRFSRFADRPLTLQKEKTIVHPQSGNTVLVWGGMEVDLHRQLIDWSHCFEEIGPSNEVIRKVYGGTTTRYTTRFEMQYLFELCGFEKFTVYGDFYMRSFDVQDTQLWIAHK